MASSGREDEGRSSGADWSAWVADSVLYAHSKRPTRQGAAAPTVPAPLRGGGRPCLASPPCPGRSAPLGPPRAGRLRSGQHPLHLGGTRGRLPRPAKAPWQRAEQAEVPLAPAQARHASLARPARRGGGRGPAGSSGRPLSSASPAGRPEGLAPPRREAGGAMASSGEHRSGHRRRASGFLLAAVVPLRPPGGEPLAGGGRDACASSRQRRQRRGGPARGGPSPSRPGGA